MPDERFEDEPVVGDEIVRGFMYTEGRTRAQGASELPLETLVSLTTTARNGVGKLRFERRAIAQQLDGKRSVAEIAAQLNIPFRAAMVITSEMVAEGLLVAEEVVADVDLPLLRKIRDAIAAL
jgi:hypothetical protein